MDELYVTYADDEHVDNHDYDDNTDDDHDNNNDINVRACNARVNASIYIYIYLYVRRMFSYFFGLFALFSGFCLVFHAF